jgi:putative addiction module component (TIGR02574 family)
MSQTLKALNIDTLSVDERIALVTEIWNSIAVEPGAGLLSEGQRAELRNRAAEHAANPDDVIPWEQAKAAALKRIGK